MPIYPTLSAGTTSRDITELFYGYDHRLKIADGYFYDTKNLSTSFYPMLAPRKKRSVIMENLTGFGGIIEKDALAYVKDGTLYYNYAATGLTGLSTGEKQLVSMGAYIAIFPDKKYFNTENHDDYGSMEASWSSQNTGTVKYYMCRADGTNYTCTDPTSEEPTDQSVIWVKESGSGRTLWYYSESNASWMELNTVYLKMEFNTYGVIPGLFKEYDGVTIAGSMHEEANGSKLLYAVGGQNSDDEEERIKDFIVIVYPMDQREETESGTISITRTVPKMDYVTEAQNRLWGCYYGYNEDTGETVNEIYCCALGDFKNWQQYIGLSTDSYAASVGTDGQWTGAVNYLGSPTFFKENHIHIVSVSQTGAHQITELPARGVQKGSYKSLRVVNETLYYKSRTDVCAYTGSFPSGVSEALGDEIYSNAVAGSFGEKYYISMYNATSGWNLFCFDAGKGLWMREDNLQVKQFARVDGSLYAWTAGNKLIDLNNATDATHTVSTESTVEWAAETGILYYAYPDNKYVTRFNIRMKGNADSVVHCYVEYDSDGEWQDKGTIRMNGINTVTLPITPHRCDHMRIKLEGTGYCRIFSIARILEVGSDL